jgi:hypothetical protein
MEKINLEFFVWWNLLNLPELWLPKKDFKKEEIKNAAQNGKLRGV